MGVVKLGWGWAGQGGWGGDGERQGKEKELVGEGCRQIGGENRHSQRAKQYRKQEKKNKTKWTNRKRIGNLLIKANRTCDSILVWIYITPHTDPGTLVATSGPSDIVRGH